MTPGIVKVFVFGGCAVHMYTNVRGSDDLDIEIEATKLLDVSELLVEADDVYYTDSAGEEKNLILDTTFNAGLSPVKTPDYKSRAIPLATGDSIMHVFLVSALDIATSKLDRCGAADVTDILALYAKGLFSLAEFKQEAENCLDYPATQGNRIKLFVII